MDAYTIFHVILSLLAIAAGFVILGGFLTGRRLDGWNAFFLVTTVATSATGFGFPFVRFLPSHGVGIVSLVILAVAIYARYSRRLAGGWQTAYIVTAIAAFYLNFFVLIVQAFLKVPSLHALAPKQTEWPFAVAQLVALAAFIYFGVLAVKKSRSPSLPLAD
jgi:hypothetical protein